MKEIVNNYDNNIPLFYLITHFDLVLCQPPPPNLFIFLPTTPHQLMRKEIGF